VLHLHIDCNDENVRWRFPACESILTDLWVERVPDFTATPLNTNNNGTNGMLSFGLVLSAIYESFGTRSAPPLPLSRVNPPKYKCFS
jgi:hypothetical protein